MPTGFLLVLIGIQLNFVQTYTLSARATKFWAERIADPSDLTDLQTSFNGNPSTTPFSQASYRPFAQPVDRPMFLRAKQITPPNWICWPVIFVGAFFCVQGILLKRA